MGMSEAAALVPIVGRREHSFDSSATLRHLPADDEELVDAAHRVAARVREFAQFVACDLDLDGLTSSTSGSMTFHPSCHGLRYLSFSGYRERTLNRVGAVHKPLNAADECFGFGGLFAIEMSEISGARIDTKIDHVAAATVIRKAARPFVQRPGGGDGSWAVVRSAGFVVFNRDDGPDPSPNVPIAFDLGPSRVDGYDEFVEDSVGDVLVECAFVPV